MPNPDGSQTFEEFRDNWIKAEEYYKSKIDEIEIRYAYQEYLSILSGNPIEMDKTIRTAQVYLWQRENWRLN